MHRRRLLVAAAAAAALAPALVRAQDGNPEDQRYYGGALAVADMVSWFFDEETRLTTNFESSSLLDEDWKIDVLAPFSIPRAAQETLRNLDPPAAMRESHDLFLDSVGYLVDAEPYMRDGVMNLNADALATATNLVDLAGTALGQASAALPSQ